MPKPKSFPKRIGAVELTTRLFPPQGSKIEECIVAITTGSVKNAGTDAHVYLEIAGRNALLGKPNYDDFERGDVEEYFIASPQLTLDELRKATIRLHHDNTGKKPGWYVQGVDLKIRFKDESVFHLYKRWGTVGWLAVTEAPYYTTEAILQDGTELG